MEKGGATLLPLAQWIAWRQTGPPRLRLPARPPPELVRQRPGPRRTRPSATPCFGPRPPPPRVWPAAPDAPRYTPRSASGLCGVGATGSAARLCGEGNDHEASRPGASHPDFAGPRTMRKPRGDNATWSRVQTVSPAAGQALTSALSGGVRVRGVGPCPLFERPAAQALRGTSVETTLPGGWRDPDTFFAGRPLEDFGSFRWW